MPPSISVLLVDDEPQLLELTKFYIEKTGEISAETALSARQASDMMAQKAYDAIVCDYQMPDMDGLEFLKALRNQKNDIPFILFTGKGREDVAIASLNSGADFYLQKGGDPISQFAELTNMIKAAVAARRAQAQLARSEELFRLLAENSKDLVFRMALIPEPRFEYVSPSSTEIVGYTPEEHYANPRLGFELVHPDDRGKLEEMTSGPDEPKGPIVIRWVTKDGRMIYTEQRVVRIKDEEGRVVAIEGTAIDITERVKAEGELRASEARYRSIFETTGSSMVIVGDDGCVLLVNSEFERLSGYTKAEVQGKMKWTDFIAPEDVEAMVAYHSALARDPESVPRGFQFKAKDRFGSELYMLANVTIVPGAGQTIVSIVDETDRRRYEEAIQQAGRKMDLLARITRHDILNQLAVLYGYLELAKERVGDPANQAIIGKAIVASESIRRHIEFARDYQNMGTKRPQWVDVQAACKRASTNMELKDVKVVAELGDLEVFADPMLEKVFYNLIDNSIKHGEKTTRISFRYSHGSDGMRLIYEDDGVGVPQEDKEAIFERSLADTGGRRGYGLYLATEILGITGITLAETGRPGEGARFEMLVPRGKYRSKGLQAGRGRRKSRH